MSKEWTYVHSMANCPWHGQSIKCPLTVCLFILHVVSDQNFPQDLNLSRKNLTTLTGFPEPCLCPLTPPYMFHGPMSCVIPGKDSQPRGKHILTKLKPYQNLSVSRSSASLTYSRLPTLIFRTVVDAVSVIQCVNKF